jgi:hypothetical protein
LFLFRLSGDAQLRIDLVPSDQFSFEVLLEFRNIQQGTVECAHAVTVVPSVTATPNDITLAMTEPGPEPDLLFLYTNVTRVCLGLFSVFAQSVCMFMLHLYNGRL